jgi:hypothetical protein
LLDTADAIALNVTVLVTTGTCRSPGVVGRGGEGGGVNLGSSLATLEDEDRDEQPGRGLGAVLRGVESRDCRAPPASPADTMQAAQAREKGLSWASSTNSSASVFSGARILGQTDVSCRA